MLTTLPFNEHMEEYEEWFDKYPFAFQSEVEADRILLCGNHQRGLLVA